MKSDDITAAAERRRKHEARTRDEDSPYYVLALNTRDGWYWDGKIRDDLRILADAYLALGERREDKWAVTDSDDSLMTYGTDKELARRVAAKSRVGAARVVRVATFVQPIEE